MRYCDECGGHVIVSIGSMWSKLNFCSPACSLEYHRRIKELAEKEANDANIEGHTVNPLIKEE